MVYALVNIKTGDFEKWKAGFEAAAGLRQSYGSKGVRPFRNADKAIGAGNGLQTAAMAIQSHGIIAAVVTG